MLAFTRIRASQAPLGGLQEDLVKYLGAGAGGIYDSLMAEIRTQAAAGAKAQVMPLIIGLGAVTGIVAVISISTAIAVRKRQ